MGIRQRRKMHWMAYFWPGLPHLWNRGSWAGLALAVGFTVLLNVLLVATLVWTGWMSPEARQIGYGVLVVIWSLAWLESRADWQRFLAERRVVDKGHLQNVGTVSLSNIGREGTYGEEGANGNGVSREVESEEMSDRLYRGAQQHYLAGDWVRCEQLLRQLVMLDKRDVESQLMLATMWRHLGRKEEAARQLRRLECLEAAAPWSYEIARELDLIVREPDELDQSFDPQQFDLHADDSQESCPPIIQNESIKNEITKNEATTSVTIDEHPAQSEQQQQTNDQSSRAA